MAKEWSTRLATSPSSIIAEHFSKPDCPEGTFHFGPGKVDQHCSLFHYWSLHVEGANFAFSNCSVRFVAYDIGREIYPP
jgi:hypothetical protein